jgi:hypothetical protein
MAQGILRARKFIYGARGMKGHHKGDGARHKIEFSTTRLERSSDDSTKQRFDLDRLSGCSTLVNWDIFDKDHVSFDPSVRRERVEAFVRLVGTRYRHAIEAIVEARGSRSGARRILVWYGIMSEKEAHRQVGIATRGILEAVGAVETSA